MIRAEQNRIDAEAAAWLARLHGDAPAGASAALDAWLAEDPAHAAAFDRAHAVWAILPRAARQEAEAPDLRPAKPRVRRLQPAFAIAAAVALLAGFGALWWAMAGTDAYATRPGEQRVATLADGSRIALNTDTRVGVRFDPDRRRIELDRGEAMFEVAHDADRPFVVVAGDTEVRAIGTVFLVRRTRDDVVVTLIKGKVAVSHARPAPSGAAPVVLQPGEKLTEPTQGIARIETASVEAATAWRRGQTVFHDTPLGSAVAELNRYGGTRIVIEDPRVAALPVSGVFATNAADFAEAAATLHGLKVEKDGEKLHITR